MRIGEEAVLETLRQIQGFLDDNDAILATVNQSNARRRLDELVAKMKRHAVEQLGGRRTAQGETAKQRVLRQALRLDYMTPIAIVAEQLLPEQPEFTKLVVPKWDTSKAALIAAAYDMANVAEKHADLFVQEGLAPDFVAELRAAADRLVQSLDARGQGKLQGAGATAGLKSATKRGRAQIRLLDSLVRPKLGTNDTLLREWQSAKHIRARGSSGAHAGQSSAGSTSGPTLTVSSTPSGPVVAA